MSSTDRQNRLLVAEDWKRVYQSFRSADLQSYDFDNLKRAMINYLRQNYPEDFNDYIESSEYIALIDLIAFLGQNISFRIDLNSRENFIELAERRESILRLARLLSYNPKRNIPSNGLLKFSALKTTEQLFDSNGLNLSGQTILWNDRTNSNWLEQFLKILNAAMPEYQNFGNPMKTELISGIPTDQYKLNSNNQTIPVFDFQRAIKGVSTRFQVVSTAIDSNIILEEPPLVGNPLSFLFRNDGQGPGSSNTGFFIHFRQGNLTTGEFSITTPVSNQIVQINDINVNNSDIWLYSLDSNNREIQLWTKVDSIEGNNIIYNSLSRNVRKIYGVLTRVEDRINLIFSDGVFGDLPSGNFRIYYRTSNNRRQVISPQELSGIAFDVPYISRSGITEILTIGCDLQYTVNNSSTSESNESIRQKAPATYYTQNRLITGEDYNIGPLAVSQDIVKSKAVNRTSSGISRYFDLIDSTGKYSSTNIYGNDGIIYKEYYSVKSKFEFLTQSDIEGVILNDIEPLIKEKEILNFYLDQFQRINTNNLEAEFTSVQLETNRSSGYLTSNLTRLPVANFTTDNLRYLEAGALCKFIPPNGFVFDKNNKLVPRIDPIFGDVTYIWAKVISISNNGTQILSNGSGPIIFNEPIPTGCKLVEIRPKFNTNIPDNLKAEIIEQAFSYRNFGLRYDLFTRTWQLIVDEDLDISSNFSLAGSGDTTNSNIDASWLLLFTTNGEYYNVTYRALRYIFESQKEVRFYYDTTDKIYDSKTGKTVKDKINVLSINRVPDELNSFTSDFTWEIIADYRDKEGYVDSRKIQISFFDSDDDGIIDNPELFERIVEPNVNPNQKFVFQERYLTSDGSEDFRYINQDDLNILIFNTETMVGPLSAYQNNQLFYFVDVDLFKKLDLIKNQLILTTDYQAFVGRDNLKFHYFHSADEDIRIDPSVSNIIDVYLLTREYDNQFRQYLRGATNILPKPPSSDVLFNSYGSSLSKIKSISDELIYHPVKYKVLFGKDASPDLRATFKVTKNSDLSLNDNEIKTAVISNIENFFSIENWDFGDTFYFSELATYIMNQMSPNLVNIVIVPDQESQSFGSLFEIKSESDEIFISGAKISNVEIIDEITANRLKATGRVVTAVETPNVGIQSASSLSIDLNN